MVSDGPERVGLIALARYFLTLGTIGFGGSVALVGYMHRDLVERRRWLSQERLRARTRARPGHAGTTRRAARNGHWAFVFGSGLAIVPFLHQGVVQEFGWLNEHQFLDAVAVVIITPGPVVITVAFIGYLAAGLPGAVVAGLGMFAPVYVLTVGPVPWFKRNRNNPQLRAFVSGATAAATGAIAGAVVVLGRRAIIDAPTALVALASLAILLRFRIPEPVLVGVSGTLGLALWPLLGHI